MSKKKSLKMKRAWVVTWEGTNIPHSEFVTVFSSRRSGRTVCEFVERLYLPAHIQGIPRLLQCSLFSYKLAQRWVIEFALRYRRPVVILLHMQHGPFL